jgi:hypothetical protein
MNVELKEFIRLLEEMGDSPFVFNTPVTVQFKESFIDYHLKIWKDDILVLGISGRKNQGWDKHIINRVMAQMFAGFVQFVEDTQKKREGNEN